MPAEFPYAVFLSHSAKDKAVVRPLAERLRAGGDTSKDEGKRMKDETALHPSSFIIHPFPTVLCMSANAFGSDWAQLESGTLRTGQRPFRDPLNKEHRILPLRLDDAPSKAPQLNSFTSTGSRRAGGPMPITKF